MFHRSAQGTGRATDLNQGLADSGGHDVPVVREFFQWDFATLLP
ncbi:MAG TPA: hypothetical protein VH601_00255 [Bryobacteraceae bacterium]